MRLDDLTLTIPTTAQTSRTVRFPGGPPKSVNVQATFNCGGGGESVSAWLQTSLDEGASWVDIVNFTFTTASARKVTAIARANSTPLLASDGTLGADAASGAPLGRLWRVKYNVAGTYQEATSLAIYIDANDPQQPVAIQ